MALIPKITFRLLSETATTFTLEDTTGDYDVTTNPGGYGSPNVARNTMGISLYIIRDYETASDADITVDNSDGDTDTSWLIAATEGFGLYGQAALVSEVWASGTFSPNDIVWEDGVTYQQIHSTTTTSTPSATPAEWLPDTDSSFPLANIISSTASYQLVFVAAIDHVYTYALDLCLSDKLATLTLNPCANTELRQDITDIKFNLDAIDIYMFTLDTLNAERAAQIANDICNKKVCF